MTRNRKQNGVASPVAWHSAMVADRIMRAEHLRLPSGVSILAVKPEPLEWVLSGRIPQNLLSAAMEPGTPRPGDEDRVMTREEILDLAQFARQLVTASIVEPPVGDGPGEISLDDIPVTDRAFIFEWACRALRQEEGVGSRESKIQDRKSKVETRNSPKGNRQSTIDNRQWRNSPAKSWGGFVKSENFLLVAIAAQKFGCRPSSLVMLHDPVLALDFDLAATARLLAVERGAIAGGDAQGDEAPTMQKEIHW